MSVALAPRSCSVRSTEVAKMLLGSVLSPGIWYNILRGVAKVAVIVNVREILRKKETRAALF